MRLFAVSLINAEIYRSHYNFKSMEILGSVIRNYLVASGVSRCSVKGVHTEERDAEERRDEGNSRPTEGIHDLSSFLARESAVVCSASRQIRELVRA